MREGGVDRMIKQNVKYVIIFKYVICLFTEH